MRQRPRAINDRPYKELSTVVCRNNKMEWQRRKAIKESAGQDASVEKMKVREWQLKAKDFTEQTGLKRDYIRERAALQK